MSTPAGDDLVGDATIRVDGDTDPALRALNQFSRDAQGRIRDVRGRFVRETAEITAALRTIGDPEPTVTINTAPAQTALRQFTRDADGRLRDARGRFIRAADDMNAALRTIGDPEPVYFVNTDPAFNSINRLRDANGRFIAGARAANSTLTNTTGSSDRFSRALRSLAGVAGSVGGVLGRVGLSLGAVGAAAGSAAPLLAGIVTTLQNVAPAGAVAVTGMLAVRQASAVVQLGMVGVEDAITAALDPSKAAEFSKALEKLAPNARAFAEQVRSMQPAFQRLQQGVQNRLFAGLDKELQSLAKAALPAVRTNLNATADTLNRMARGAADAARQLATSGALGKAMAGANQGLSNLRQIPGQVVTALGQLAVAGAPSLDRLTAAAARAATGISERLSSAFESGALEQAVNTAVNLLRDLGTVGANVFAILGNVMAPVQQAGGGLIGVLVEITGALRQATATTGFQEAIGALAGVMGTLARTVGPLLGQALAAIGPVFTALGPPVERLITNLGSALSPIISALGPVLAAAADAMGALLDAVSPLLPVIGNLIASLLPPLVPVLQAVSQAFTGLAPIVAQVGQILTAVLAPIIATLPQILAPLIASFTQMTSTILPTVQQLLVALTPALTTLGQSLAQVLVAAAPLLVVLTQMGTQVLTQLLPVITPLIPIVGRLASVFAGQLALALQTVVVPALTAVSALLRGDFSGALENGKRLVSGFVTTVTNWFTKLPGQTFSALGTWTGKLRARATEAGAALLTATRTKLSETVTALRGLPGRAAGALGSLAGQLRGRAISAGSSMVTALRDKINEAVAAVRGMPGRAAAALGNLSGRLTSSGRALIQGFINGIREKAGEVAGAVNSVLSGARNLLPFSPAKEGPFSGKGWTLYSGQSVSEALAEGIAQRQALVRRAAQEMMRTAQAELSAPVVMRPATASAGGLGLGVSSMRATSTAAPVTNIINLNLRNDGVIGSQIELDNWLARALDNLSRTGRLPAALRSA